MIIPNTDYTREAFKKRYYAEHKTYDGWEDEFRWWINPRLECLIQNKPINPGKRCKTPCEFCIHHYNRSRNK